MKLAAFRISIVTAVTMATIACSNNQALPPTPTPTTSETFSQPFPTKEILISYARFDKPYRTIGPIEYTLKNDLIPDEHQDVWWELTIELLKKEALKKFGDKVDALVDVEIIESTEELNGKSLNVILAKGVAIAFTSRAKPTTKPKLRYKVRHKPKPSKPSSKAIPAKKTPSKSIKEDIIISPSELLK